MFEMRIDALVAAIVRATFRDGGRKDQALHFHFDLRLSDYSEGIDATKSAGLHLLYYALPGHHTITVFSGVIENPFDGIQKVPAWTHESSHDSCWRDIHATTSLYFEMAEGLNKIREQEGLEPKAPKDFSHFASFALFEEEICRWVAVEVNRDRSDPYGYQRTIKLL